LLAEVTRAAPDEKLSASSVLRILSEHPGPVNAGDRCGHLIVSRTVNSHYLLFVLVDEPA
jgi:hypothetical protein